MPFLRRNLEGRLAALSLCAVICAAVSACANRAEVEADPAPASVMEPAPEPAPERASFGNLALMGTIPIFWGEAAGLDELIGGAHPHWARDVLEQRYDLAPLDYLDGAALAPYSRLLLAQPRGLSAQENVALDEWVRQGGRLLLFVDPMMTGESRFGIGDRRRPQDVALLSPILEHWGLRLQFDRRQELGVTIREIGGREIAGQAVPVNLPGRFVPAPGGEEAACRLGEQALLARCSVGEGEVVLLADAALLDTAGPWPGAPEALEFLTRLAFGQDGEIAGE